MTSALPWQRHGRPHATANANANAGFTLIECMVVCTIVCILAAVALPSYRSQQLRGARLDAVDALTRLQLAQESLRSNTGLYAADLNALRVGSNSRQGRYALQLVSTGPDGYRASAVAIGVQEGDTACAALTLDVDHGFAQPGPNPQCWNR